MASVSFTKQVLDQIQADIVSGVGTGSGATWEITTANVEILKLPWIVDDLKLPGVLLTPVPELEKPATNASDDIGYGVQVSIAQVSNRDLDDNFDRLLYWREAISGLFREKRLSVPSGIYRCVIEPKPVIDVATFLAQLDATAFVVRVWARVQRP